MAMRGLIERGVACHLLIGDRQRTPVLNYPNYQVALRVTKPHMAPILLAFSFLARLMVHSEACS